MDLSVGESQLMVEFDVPIWCHWYGLPYKKHMLVKRTIEAKVSIDHRGNVKSWQQQRTRSMIHQICKDRGALIDVPLFREDPDHT